MRRLVLLGLLLAGAREARANSCSLYITLTATPEIPLGCPLVVYRNKELPPLEVAVEGRRNALTWDATGASTRTDAAVSVWFQTIDEACVEASYYEDVPYERISVELVDVDVGDLVTMDGAGGTIIAAGPCPAGDPPQYVYCQDPIQDYWACDPPEEYPPDDETGDGDGHEGHDHVGCSAGGGAGFALAALLAGLRRRRRATASR